jgi:hypothetical protein
LQANLNKIGQLTNGRVGDATIVPTNTIQFIHPRDLPAGYKPTYIRVVSNFREQKANPYCIRWTVSGNLIEYDGNKATPGSDMTILKVVVNSTLSTPGATFMCTDMKDFYLNTPMAQPEFLWITRAMLTDDVIKVYKLDTLMTNNNLLVRIDKGMHGLHQQAASSTTI